MTHKFLEDTTVNTVGPGGIEVTHTFKAGAELPAADAKEPLDESTRLGLIAAGVVAERASTPAVTTGGETR